MNRRSIHCYTWLPRWSTKDGERVAHRAAELGYGQLVIPLRDHETIEPEAIERFCSAAGIRPVTTSPLQSDTDISSTDAEVNRRGVERHKAALRLARDMGADRMGGVLYSAFGKAKQGPTPANFEAAAEGLASVADAAAECGITLTLEVVNRYEANLINCASDAVRLVEAIGRTNVGIHLDTFHMNIEEADMMSAIDTALPYLMYFELDQNHRGRLTAGMIDFDPLLERLNQCGYTGLVGLEAFSSTVSDPDIASGVSAWRPLFEDGDDVAREGQAILDRHGI